MGLVYKTCENAVFDKAYYSDPCRASEGGNVRSLVLIRKGTDITFPLDRAEWIEQVELGNIFIMSETRGVFDGGTEKTIQGYGKEKERVVGFDYTLQFKDPNYRLNGKFYEAAEKPIWNVAYLSETQLHYVNSDCQLSARAPIEEDMDSDVAWNVEVKWTAKDKPVMSAYSTIDDLFLPDGSAFPNEYIVGLSLSGSTQLARLDVGSGKACRIVLPDGMVIDSVAGVATATYTGAGAVRLIVPKDTSKVHISSSSFFGVAKYYGDASFDAIDCFNLNGLVLTRSLAVDARNCEKMTILNCAKAITIDTQGSELLTAIYADGANIVEGSSCFSLNYIYSPYASKISAIDSSLTAESINEILSNARKSGISNGEININDGANASYTQWSAQAKLDKDYLVNTKNWTIVYNQ